MSRLKLFIIFAAFLGPLLAAFIWYYGLGGALAPRGGTNHAPLISPVVALEAFSNADAGGGRFTLEAIKHRWSVIHLLAAECDATCEALYAKALYNTRQTRIALGKDANRVQRILLSPDRGLLSRLAAEHPDAIGLLADGDETSDAEPPGLESRLTPVLQHYNMDAGDALLVDPLGNLMMIIPAALDPTLLLKDLKHLLRVSRIG